MSTPRSLGARRAACLILLSLSTWAVTAAIAGSRTSGNSVPVLATGAKAMPNVAGGSASQVRLRPTGMRFNVCCYTTSMVTADLNGDSHADIVTGNGLSYDVSVLLSDGTGGFSDPVSFPVGSFTLGFVAVAAGDVTGDAHPDIVATGYDDDEILVYVGDGQGGFGAPASFFTGNGQYPTAVEIVDVTGDGHPDIVTANGDSSNISVLAGDGTGGFAAAANFPTGAFPTSLAVADVTGDGKSDVVTANSQTLDVSVLVGDGTGGFAAPVNLSVGADAEPTAVAAADVSGDGHVDLVVANKGLDDSPFPPPELPGTVSVLIGDGAGGFAAAVQYSAGAGDGRADAVALGDVTGDGHPDIVVSRPLANTAGVLAGDGAGGFAEAVTVPTGVGPGPVAIADTTGEGHLDVVTANAVGSSISVLPGDGEGNIGFAGNFPAGMFPFAVASMDLNDDGYPDLVSANGMSNDVSVLVNNGFGGFDNAVSYAVGTSPALTAVGDVDDDGHADLVVANLGGGDVSVLLGTGTGGFAPAANFSIGEGFQSPYAVALGDANGDGHLDIATANTNISNDSISFLLGDGTGNFAAAVMYPVGDGSFYQPQGIVLTDVTGDGHADIVTANSGANNLSVLVGDGAGNFAAAVHLTPDLGPVAVAAADVTGDGRVDLVTLNTTAQDVSVLAGDGAGGFAAAVNYAIYPFEGIVDYNPWPWGLAVADVTGDGDLDIVTANTQNDTVSVLPNDGAGGFGSFANFDTGAHPGSVTVADIDGDGKADVITANRQNNNVSVLFNESAGDVIFADGFDIQPL